MFDARSEMKKNNDDKNFMKLFLVPNTMNAATVSQARDLLTEKTIKNNYIKDIIYTAEHPIGENGYTYPVIVDLPELEYNEYIVCLYGEDVKGNYRYGPVGIYKKNRLNEKLGFESVTPSDSELLVKLSNTSIEDVEQTYAHFSFEKYDDGSKTWQPVPIDSKHFGFSTEDTYNISCEAFVRVSKCENKNQFYNNTTEFDTTSVTVPSYFFTKFGMHTGNVVQGMNGYTLMLYGNEPCLVELVYSTIKDYGAKADDWDYNVPPSQKLGAKLYYNQETYVPDTSKLPPEAKYYTSIFHFADGSSIAAPSKQIN